MLSAAFDIVVGLRLLLPDDILGSVPGYRLLDTHFVNDWVFGGGLLLLGVVMAVGLYTDRYPQLVSGAIWVSMLTWIVVAIDLVVVNPGQFGTFAYAVIAAMNGYAYAHAAEWSEQQRRDTRSDSGPSGEVAP